MKHSQTVTSAIAVLGDTTGALGATLIADPSKELSSTANLIVVAVLIALAIIARLAQIRRGA